MIKSLFEEDVQVIKYEWNGTNDWACKYIKNLIELKGEIDKSTVSFEEFNPFIVTDRIKKVKRKISEGIEDLNASIKQIVQIEIYRKLYPRKQNPHYFQMHMKLLGFFGQFHPNNF